MSHIFISYAHEDKGFVETLVWRLREAGCAVWYDDSLRGGQPWPDEVARQLETARVCVVVLSPAATVSEWVKEEVQYARVHNVPIIPLMYRDTPPPFGLSRLQYVDFCHGRDGLVDLLDALRAHRVPPGEQPLPPNPFRPLAGIIKDLTLFFDREREIREIVEVLNAGASVALIGERAVGKSSLLWALKVRLEQSSHLLRSSRRPIYINFLNVYNEEDFYEALCDQAGIPTVKGYRLKRQLEGKRFLLILDEIEKMKWEGFTRHVRAELRGLAEGEDAPLRLVLAARTSLDRLFPDSQSDDATSPLEGICQEVRLKPWDEERARAFLHDRLARTPVRFHEEDIERLLRESRSHPQILMRKAHDLYRQYVQSWEIE